MNFTIIISYNTLYLSSSFEFYQGYFHLWYFLLCLKDESGSALQCSELQQEVHQVKGYEHYKGFQLKERHSETQENNENNTNTVLLSTLIRFGTYIPVLPYFKMGPSIES